MPVQNSIIMKPTLEDVLFLNGYESDDYKEISKISKIKVVPAVTNEVLQEIIINDFNGKYYQDFLKYFSHNYKECLDASQKNSEKSLKARINANELFKKKKHDSETHEEIWKLYSHSTALAPIKSEELALAYGNRSYLLLHLKKYKSCIEDIDRALDITKSAVLKIKLLCRKMCCFVSVNSSKENREKLWIEIRAHFDKLDESSKDQRISEVVNKAKIDMNQKSIHTKTDESPKIPCVSQSKVSVVCDKKKNGRHVLSTQDFATGDAVAITKPVVGSVNLNKFYAYCSHCLSQMWAGIPCDECSLCMYCSEKCKTEAWEKYHEVECKILPHINFDSTFSYHLQISVKAIIMGIKETSSISQLIEKTREIDSCRGNKGAMQNNTIFDSEFINLYSLPWINPATKDFSKLLRFSKNACFLIAYMTQTCDIFGRNVKSMEVKELAKDNNIVFLGTLMLKLLMSSLRHSEYVQGITIQRYPCNKYFDIEECTGNRCCLRGMYIDSFEKNFKNSCDPNISMCCTDDNGKIIYYCIKPIKAKDEIFISRFDPFFKSDRNIRKKYMQRAGYNCKCIACLEDWSTTDKLLEKYTHCPSAVHCNEDDIAENYLKKHSSKGYLLIEDETVKLKQKDLQELAEDTNKVVESCGQPSFLSSTMMTFLIIAYERLYGVSPLHLPAEC